MQEIEARLIRSCHHKTFLILYCDTCMFMAILVVDDCTLLKQAVYPANQSSRSRMLQSYVRGPRDTRTIICGPGMLSVLWFPSAGPR